jgi:hypothetical protein
MKWGLPNDRNDERLAALKDVHRGRRAFLIGNGPSLTAADLSLLKDEITFASNKIYLIYDQTDWRPTYLTCCDAVVARNLKERFLGIPTPKIFAFGVAECYQDCMDEITWVNPPTPAGDAEWDAIKGFRAGHSVVNLDIKLAYWMGITELYVIGLDFSFVVPQTATGEEVFGNKVIVSEGEVNHFHPDYRPAGEEWTVPKLDEQRQEFVQARRFLEARGAAIYNASRQTKLDVWDRVDLDTVLRGDLNVKVGTTI